MIKIWKKYIFFETLKLMLFFILCFNLIYLLIDYSIHAGHFSKDASTSLSQIVLYYFFQWIKRLDLILPLSLMLSSTKVLTSFNQNNELMSLRLGGLSLRSLIAPLFFLSLLSSLMVLLNFEFLIPRSLSYIDHFEDVHFKQMILSHHEKKGLYSCLGADGQKVLYRRFDPKKNLLEDVFVIDSFDSLWKIQALSLADAHPIGHFADHFKRDQDGVLQKDNSYNSISLLQLAPLSHTGPFSSLQAEDKSLSCLFRHYTFLTGKDNLPIRSHFIYKIMISLLSVIVVLAVVPYSTSFSRNFKNFLTYTFSLFGFIVWITIMDAFMIVSQSGALQPELLLIMPMLVVSLVFTISFFQKAH